jgi:hypothetical protein
MIKDKRKSLLDLYEICETLHLFCEICVKMFSPEVLNSTPVELNASSAKILQIAVGTGAVLITQGNS